MSNVTPLQRILSFTPGVSVLNVNRNVASDATFCAALSSATTGLATSLLKSACNVPVIE